MPANRVRAFALGLLAAGVCVALVLLMREIRRVPATPAAHAPGRAESNPLTDVARRSRGAPSAPSLNVSAEAARQEAIERGQEVAEPAPYVLPNDVPDPSNPPQWTKPRATPGEPMPPDPFQPPAMAQDPDRGRRGAASSH